MPGVNQQGKPAEVTLRLGVNKEIPMRIAVLKKDQENSTSLES